MQPSLNVVMVIHVLIQISKNKSLLFSVNDEHLEVEKSIFFGEKKIIDSYCITISGNLVNKNKIFKFYYTYKLKEYKTELLTLVISTFFR